MIRSCIIRERHFSPAEVESIFDIPTGTQRQWRSRGFIEREDAGQRAGIGLRELSGLVCLRHCRDLGIALVTAAQILPGISEEARRYIILEEVPLRFRGTAEDRDEYQLWRGENQLTELNQVSELLGPPQVEVARHAAIEADRAYLLQRELDDNPKRNAITKIIVDAWAVGELVRSKAEDELAWLERKAEDQNVND